MILEQNPEWGSVPVLKPYRLATAEILYHMPDYPGVLQSFTWQHMDLAPSYPELRKFLAYWEENLDGPLHSVRVARADVMGAAGYRSADAWMQIH